MLRKTYFAETVDMFEDKPVVCGGIMRTCWFWQSPAVAYKRMLDAGEIVINFRRIQ